VTSQGLSSAAISLLGDGQLDTLALGQGDPGLVRTDNEDVVLACSESVVNGVLDMDDVETTIVTFTVGDDTNTTHVTTTGDHGNGTSIEVNEVFDLAGGKVDLDGIVDLDQRVGVTDAVAKRTHISSWIRGDTHTSHQFEARQAPRQRGAIVVVCGVEGWFNQSLIQRLNDV
jgi:hypothetical protein